MLKPSEIEPLGQPEPLPDRHWPGTDGAHDVRTRHVMEGLVRAGEAAREHSICALYGPPGLSKTYTALLLAELLNIPYRYLETKPIGGRTAFLQAVLRKLEVPFRPRDRSPELLDRMAEACQTTRVLVIDEADRAHDFGMEIIRYCLAQATNRTTFVLVGWKIDSLIARNPALDSRIAWRHEYQPLDHEDLIAALRAYHHLFADAPEPLLQRIGSFTEGQFRRIAQVLAAILQRLPAGDQPVLTDALLDAVFDSTGQHWRGGGHRGKAR
jgi:Cdc6-like AAA superfamily ATPase